jgi:hypothetical protein
MVIITILITVSLYTQLLLSTLSSLLYYFIDNNYYSYKPTAADAAMDSVVAASSKLPGNIRMICWRIYTMFETAPKHTNDISCSSERTHT